MTISQKAEERGYESLYQGFDSPLMQQVRREAYGRDIGQHSWVSADELQADASQLGLSGKSRLLDLGCGPGGPLTFVAGLVRCKGTGLDVSASAIVAARSRAISLGVEQFVTFDEADLNKPLPFASNSFDAVLSLDVILHLHDRLAVFREVARTLAPAGKFLFTDAGVITGAISDEEVRRRSIHGHAQFVPPGFNEKTLEAAGFRVVDRQDRTASVLKTALARLTSRASHRDELERLESKDSFEKEQGYLETVAKLSERKALSRMMYFAEAIPDGHPAV